MELDQILQSVPQSLRALTENHQNLLNVADYCSNNYLQTSRGSSEALSETRALLTQSLASVAFQIHSVAESLLRVLDLQTDDLKNLESSVDQLDQSVQMHKEKVARRVIGSFTAQRRVPRCHKLLPPPQPKPLLPYSRRPISFTLLDSVGHGHKGVKAERTGTVRKTGSYRVKLQEPTSPSVGSFGRPVAPPTVPSSWQAPPLSDEPLPLNEFTEKAPPPPPEVSNENQPEPITPPPPPPIHKPEESLDLSGSEPLATPPMALPSVLTPPLDPPPPPLETVLEEPLFPPPPDDITENAPLSPEDIEAPPPPPPPPITEDLAACVSRRSRHRAPPTLRSHSLRVRSGPASRCFTRSLFLPLSQSLMVPPPPPFPPPTAPPTGSRPHLPVVLPASLRHLDLEIPPPPPLIQDQD